MAKGYENLLVWQKSLDLVELVYKTITSFPKDEKYGLVDQIKRAAVSVPSNIAEGSERDSIKDFIRFLNISKGSLGELHTQLIIARRVGFLSQDKVILIEESIKELGRMINGLKNGLNSKMVVQNSELITNN